MSYVIDVAYQRLGKRLIAQNVLVPVAQYFALFGIPHPNQLTLVNKFWANPLSTVKRKAAQALAYTKQQADILTDVAPRVA